MPMIGSAEMKFPIGISPQAQEAEAVAEQRDQEPPQAVP